MSNADIRGRFMWHELMTTDTDAASAFYSKVMPWKTQPSGMPGYTLWYAGKTQAGGLMALPEQPQGGAPHWLTYIGTPSVDSSLEGVQRLGGKVLKGATDIPNVGRYAVVADPQGAAFALYTPASAPTDGAGAGGAAPGGYSWHELATTDLEGAVKFYTELFGWEKGPGHDMGGDIGIYQLITQGGQQIGGIFKSPNATPPNWLTYVHVADIDKAANAVKGGGGRVMNGPHQVPGGSWILQAMDPQGGAFAVIEPAEMASSAAAEKPAQPPKAAAKPAPKPAAPKPPAAAPAAKEAAPATAPAPKPAAKPAAKKAAAPKKAAKKAAKKPAAKKAAPKAAKSKGAAKRGAARKSAKKSAKKSARKAKSPVKPKAKAKARKGK